MKKKKLRAKLDKTKRKLADTRTELDAMLSIMAASGMPNTASAVGKKLTQTTAATPKLKATPSPKKPAPKSKSSSDS